MSDLQYYLAYPGEIPLNFTLPDNEQYTITFGDLVEQANFAHKYLVIHGSSITLCITLFILLLVFIKKKATPVNMLNLTILPMLVLRSALFIAYQFGPLASLTATFTGIVKDSDKSKYKISVASNAFLIIVVFLIQSSFTYQMFVIFKSPEVKKFGWVITSVSLLLQLVTFGFYINNAIADTRYYRAIFYDAEPFRQGSWETDLPSILFTASVLLMSLVLVLKLISAIRTRRYLGLKQFSSYHVLLIMFTQTLFIPAVLNTCARWDTAYNRIMLDVSLTLVAISLPFTTLWSTLANNTRSLSSTGSIFLTSSNNSSTDSDWNGVSSPTRFRDDASEEETTHEDDFAFFPSKLQKSSSETSDSQFSGSTTKALSTTGNCFGSLEKNAEASIPDDILQILEEQDDVDGITPSRLHDRWGPFEMENK